MAMRRIHIIDTLRLTSGLVALSADQARGRERLFEPTDTEGVYRITQTNEFKRGEVLGYDGEIPKGLEHRVEYLDAGAADEETNAHIGNLVVLIGMLEEGNPEHWTRGGKPSVDALEEAIDADVTAADRDKAWELYQQRMQTQ